jgi:hypothetical protein
VTRRVLALATFSFALVIGVLVIVSSRRTSVEPKDPVTPAPAASRATPRPAAPVPEKPAAAPRPATRAPARESASPEPATVETVTELGMLRIETDVPGAQVFIDRQFIGTTPVTAANVKPGTHQLNLTAQGFDGIAQTIDVEPGPRDLMFRFREVRLDASLAVVHKHRIGSCEGRLVATADGIRYETAALDASSTSPTRTATRIACSCSIAMSKRRGRDSISDDTSEREVVARQAPLGQTVRHRERAASREADRVPAAAAGAARA